MDIRVFISTRSTQSALTFGSKRSIQSSRRAEKRKRNPPWRPEGFHRKHSQANYRIWADHHAARRPQNGWRVALRGWARIGTKGCITVGRTAPIQPTMDFLAQPLRSTRPTNSKDVWADDFPAVALAEFVGHEIDNNATNGTLRGRFTSWRPDMIPGARLSWHFIGEIRCTWRGARIANAIHDCGAPGVSR
jgi:hypothetical protein